MAKKAVPESLVDWLYTGLAPFTALYMAALAFEFFANLHVRYPAVELLLSALEYPYLSALALYVILKELRKSHRHNHYALPIRHGEYFVYLWLVLLTATTVAVFGTDRYQFDISYRSIISNGLTSLVIYAGARLRKYGVG